MPQVFSVPIFLIVLRETVEAAIILSVLLALVEQIVKHNPIGKTLTDRWAGSTTKTGGAAGSGGESSSAEDVGSSVEGEKREQRLVKRLRIQIFAGTFAGLFCAVCIGAAFLAVYYTEVSNLYGESEELWEGIFSMIAMIMIFVMGLTMLRMDRAKVKWRLKLSRAFENEASLAVTPQGERKRRFAWVRNLFSGESADGEGKSSKYILFFLPFVTVLREGLEAVVFVGGVSLGQPATSIPLAAIVGLFAGLLIGYLLYSSSSRLNLSIFLVVSTAFLMLIGAGLLAKAAWYFTLYPFIKTVGGDVAEAGDGPGSFPVEGVIWHVNYGNPGNNADPGGWGIFAAIFGWNNTGTIATVLCYIGFWLAVIIALVYMKWQEGRTTFFGLSSRARKDRLARREQRQAAGKGPAAHDDGSASDEKEGIVSDSDEAPRKHHEADTIQAVDA